MKKPEMSCLFAACSWACAIVICGLLPAAQAAEGDRPAVKHPNLLLNREEIGQIKEKIRTQDWAAKLFERVKGMADECIAKGTVALTPAEGGGLAYKEVTKSSVNRGTLAPQ